MDDTRRAAAVVTVVANTIAWRNSVLISQHILSSLCSLTPSLSPAVHSVQYFYTASSGVPGFPEFVAVGMFDGVQFVHYDSDTMRAKPKQDWIKNISTVDPQYWERESLSLMGDQQWFQANIETISLQFNHTEGWFPF